MTADRPQQTNAPDNSQHARDLMARLYREIGISAVAAALRFTSQTNAQPIPDVLHPVPGVLRINDLAA